VCIDPYRTRTAKTADLYLQPRPGTDGALALRMMRVLTEEGLVDHEYIHLATFGYGGDRNLLSRACDDPRRNAGRDPAPRSKAAPEALVR
jgi:anaerobic selenocysteine-containing dehydrogenase